MQAINFRKLTIIFQTNIVMRPSAKLSRLHYIVCTFSERQYWHFSSFIKKVYLFVWWCLTPLSTIFQLYRGGQLYWRRKPEYPDKNHRPVARHWQALSHNVVHLALIEIRTHNISGNRHWLHRYSPFDQPKTGLKN